MNLFLLKKIPEVEVRREETIVKEITREGKESLRDK